MEKLVQPYDIECMKTAMLKHEETFRQQVYELHRLYQIQKTLMTNMQRSMQNQETWSSRNGTVCFKYQSDYALNRPQKQDLEYPTDNEYDVDESGSLQIEDESEIELTLGPTTYNRRRNRLMLTTPLFSDSMTSFSSSSTGSNHKTRVLSVEEQMTQVDTSVNRPPWLRQVLI